MTFVVDASIIAAWLMPDEHDPVGETMASRLAKEDAVAPGIWWFEIRNVFLMAERRGRLTPQATAKAIEHLVDLRIESPHELDEGQLLHLARRHRLTLYDAAYLELARRLVIPLATLDRDLRSAAGVEGVKLIGVDVP